MKIDGFPSSSLNRSGVVDPYYGTYNVDFGIKYNVLESMETVVPADIQVNAYWANADMTEIKVESSATFFEDTKNAGYKVGYLLINNGLTGEGGDWVQSNNYNSYAGQYDGTGLEVITTWPSKVEGLIFNDVVVDVTAQDGVDGAVPSDISFNVPYASEYSFDIASNSVIQDKDKLYVAAFIINPNGSILNANKAKVPHQNALSYGWLPASWMHRAR